MKANLGKIIVIPLPEKGGLYTSDIIVYNNILIEGDRVIDIIPKDDDSIAGAVKIRATKAVESIYKHIVIEFRYADIVYSTICEKDGEVEQCSLNSYIAPPNWDYHDHDQYTYPMYWGLNPIEPKGLLVSPDWRYQTRVWRSEYWLAEQSGRINAQDTSGWVKDEDGRLLILENYVNASAWIERINNEHSLRHGECQRPHYIICGYSR
jgi:hypothetical protein